MIKKRNRKAIYIIWVEDIDQKGNLREDKENYLGKIIHVTKLIIIKIKANMKY